VHLPGVSSDQDPRPFWWILGGALALLAAMLAFLRRKGSL
jgi:Mg2+ and Co2+ transporter CorA